MLFVVIRGFVNFNKKLSGKNKYTFKVTKHFLRRVNSIFGFYYLKGYNSSRDVSKLFVSKADYLLFYLLNYKRFIKKLSVKVLKWDRRYLSILTKSVSLRILNFKRDDKEYRKLFKYLSFSTILKKSLNLVEEELKRRTVNKVEIGSYGKRSSYKGKKYEKKIDYLVENMETRNYTLLESLTFN